MTVRKGNFLHRRKSYWDSCIFYMDFEHGFRHDASPANHILNPTGAAITTSTDGKAGTFNGSSTRIEAATYSPGDLCGGGITIIADFETDTLAEVDTLLGRPYDATHTNPYWEYFMGINSFSDPDDAVVRINTVTWEPGTTVATGTRYWWGFTADGTTWTFYVNGVVHATNADTTLPSDTNSQPIKVGANADDGEFFDGTMHSSMIFSRALTSAEMSEVYLNRYDEKKLAANRMALWQQVAAAASSSPQSSTLLGVG